MDGPPLPSQAGWPALLPRHPPTLPLPGFIPCVYGARRVISVQDRLSTLIISARLMDRSLGNLGNGPLPATLPNLSHLPGIRGGASLPVLGVGGSDGGGSPRHPSLALQPGR